MEVTTSSPTLMSVPQRAQTDSASCLRKKLGRDCVTVMVSKQGSQDKDEKDDGGGEGSSVSLGVGGVWFSRR